MWPLKRYSRISNVLPVWAAVVALLASASARAVDCNSNGVEDALDLAGINEAGKLHAGDGGDADTFGRAVAISGDLAVIGADFDGTGQSPGGRAYVFRRTGGSWQQVAKLVGADTAAGDRLGFSVAIDGTTAVVGAWRDGDAGNESGSAYVFQEVGGVWLQRAKLTASDAAPNDQFGYAVAMHGNTILIGAPGDDDGFNSSGSCYLFREVGGIWQQMSKLHAADPAAGDLFGYSVAVGSGVSLIGAYRDDDAGADSGSAYVFREVGGQWSQVAKLTAADAAAGDGFGKRIALDGTTALIAAPNDDDHGTNSGSVYVFGDISGVWQQETKLSAADGMPGAVFGESNALHAHRIAVGVWGDDTAATDAGAVYLFEKTAGVWSQAEKLYAADAFTNDRLGTGIAIGDRELIAGAPNDDDLGNASGSAYVWTFRSADVNSNAIPDECEPDCNANAVPDGLDISAGTSGDCQPNGVPDECEVVSPILYFTTSTSLVRARLDGGVENLGTYAPIGVAIDESVRRLYSLRQVEGEDLLWRVRFDGTLPQTVCSYSIFGTGVPAPAIAIDPESGRIHWADDSDRAIRRVNPDGTGLQSIVGGVSGIPPLPILGLVRGIAIDAQPPRIYWTDDAYDVIRRANLDGSNVTTLVSGAATYRGVGVDALHGRLYWVDAAPSGGGIRRASLSGTGQETVVAFTGGHSGEGLAIDSAAGKMYWTDPVAGSIRRANLDGSAIEDVVTGLQSPGALALQLDADCNLNGVPNECEADCNGDGEPDVCGLDDDADGVANACDNCAYAPNPDQRDVDNDAQGDVCDPDYHDCNANGIADVLDIASGTSADCQPDGVPDECPRVILEEHFEAGLPPNWTASSYWHVNSTCATAGVSDGLHWAYFGDYLTCALPPFNPAQGPLTVQNLELPPDTTLTLRYSSAISCSANGQAWVAVNGATVEDLSTGCASGGVTRRSVDLTPFAGQTVELSFNFISPGLTTAFGWLIDNVVVDAAVLDCDEDGVPDECDLAPADCNANEVRDACDIHAGTSSDVNHNAIPDECEFDCNANGVLDALDIAGGTSADCQGNGVPDECEVTSPAMYFTTADVLGRARPDGGWQTVLDDPEIAGIGVDEAERRLYWVKRLDYRDVLQSMSLDGGPAQTVVEYGFPGLGEGAPAIAVDPVDHKVYWADNARREMYRVNSDGSEFEVIIADLFTGSPPWWEDPGVRGIAIDPLARKIYWTYSHDSYVRRANLDGTGVEAVVDFQGLAPLGLALDPAAGEIYWAVANGGGGLIVRADTTGGAATVVVGFLSLNAIDGLALDAADGKLYWTDPGAGRIRRANLDGSEIDDVVTGLNAPKSLALHTRIDCNGNGVPDDCEADSNGDGIPDACAAGGPNFIACLSGPAQEPAPAPPLTAGECLAAFDADGDGDVDLYDYAAWSVTAER